MSELLARLARTLKHRWKMSALGAFLGDRPDRYPRPARA